MSSNDVSTRAWPIATFFFTRRAAAGGGLAGRRHQPPLPAPDGLLLGPLRVRAFVFVRWPCTQVAPVPDAAVRADLAEPVHRLRALPAQVTLATLRFESM